MHKAANDARLGNSTVRVGRVWLPSSVAALWFILSISISTKAKFGKLSEAHPSANHLERLTHLPHAPTSEVAPVQYAPTQVHFYLTKLVIRPLPFKMLIVCMVFCPAINLAVLIISSNLVEIQFLLFPFLSVVLDATNQQSDHLLIIFCACVHCSKPVDSIIDLST